MSGTHLSAEHVGWRSYVPPAIRQYTEAAPLAAFVLGISSGAPFAMIAATLTTRLAQDGIDKRAITAFSLAFLVYNLKWLWAWVVDGVRLPIIGRLGQRVSWLLFAGALAFAAIVNLALVLAARVGWEMAYLACASFALPAMAVGLIFGEPARHREPQQGVGFSAIVQSVIGPFVEFLRRQGAALVLLFVLVHKVGDTLANLTLRLLLEDRQYSNDAIALYDVGFGFWAYLTGIFVGGMLYARVGMRRAVLISLWLMAVSNLSFAGLAMVGKSNWALAATIGFENVASGIGGVAVVAYFSALCDLRYTAAQYALISAAASVVGRLLTGTTAGALVEKLGYVNYYLLTTAAALPGILLFWLMMRSGLDTTTSNDNKGP